MKVFEGTMRGGFPAGTLVETAGYDLMPIEDITTAHKVPTLNDDGEIDYVHPTETFVTPGPHRMYRAESLLFPVFASEHQNFWVQIYKELDWRWAKPADIFGNPFLVRYDPGNKDDGTRQYRGMGFTQETTVETWVENYPMPLYGLNVPGGVIRVKLPKAGIRYWVGCSASLSPLSAPQ